MKIRNERQKERETKEDKENKCSVVRNKETTGENKTEEVKRVDKSKARNGMT